MARVSASATVRGERRGTGLGGVVVGTDGSPWGSAALGWAARHAWLTGRELVVHQSGAEPSTSDRPLTLHPLPVRVREAGPDPLRTLVPASEHAALVVLGCRGQQHRSFGLGRWVLAVVAAAHCDTVVVRGLDEAVHGRYGSVTALIGGVHTDRGVLARAAAMAAASRSVLRVVHAQPPGAVDGQDPQDVLDRARDLLALHEPRISVDLVAVPGLPYEAVAACGRTDLLVVGAGAGGRLGTVTKEALHHALCPVLAVHV
ncbi:universal stress protein [Kutzneria viridogrisea]|uniref:UspA domain-containing protein n=2 Tax=Kutzneria TaxID=43356 RepID=W5W9H6_9PSEU|nr:universal stress protein [Kutzneria albida]AHH97768.1 hypothetical protein KALB_4406 [Kutzneria albida DSM 43870]MBA8924645.1 nucleotide-binding universal stress UspA family protein [Kutzneria viridogrisea]